MDKVFIRAKDNEGKWGSFSLQELCDMGQTGQAFHWILQTMCGIENGDEISTENVQELFKLLPVDRYVSLK